jgi:hypothetical protein
MSTTADAFDPPPGRRALDFLAEHRHSRNPIDRDQGYTLSYRAIRLVVGFLGVLLPILFIIGETLFLKGGVHVRGSLSAYYHTSMQDVFVGGLCVIGLMLVSYMAGELRTLDFWASVIAGIAVLGVVFFPTSRSGLPAHAPRCGSDPQPLGCSFVEQTLGEHETAVIHGVCAIVFILSLAVMSLLFATSEGLPWKAQAAVPGGRKSLFWTHSACAIVILGAVVWAFLGAQIWELTPLYVGEVASVWAFASSWLLASFRLTAPLRTAVPEPVTT